jgi:hypothetical protein
MKSSFVTLKIYDGKLHVTSGSSYKTLTLSETQGFDLRLDDRTTQRFYIMGENLVHESQGILRVLGSEMNLHLNQEFKPSDLVVIAPLEQAPITRDYINLFAMNLQHVLMTIEEDKRKEYEKKLISTNLELKKAKDFSIRVARKLDSAMNVIEDQRIELAASKSRSQKVIDALCERLGVDTEDGLIAAVIKLETDRDKSQVCLKELMAKVDQMRESL